LDQQLFYGGSISPWSQTGPALVKIFRQVQFLLSGQTTLWLTQYQDHTIFGSAYRVNVQTASAVGNPKLYMEAVDLFNKNATGFLASNGADFLGK
jgi:hypothetical protein